MPLQLSHGQGSVIGPDKFEPFISRPDLQGQPGLRLAKDGSGPSTMACKDLDPKPSA